MARITPQSTYHANRICCLSPGNQTDQDRPLKYFGGWLFTSPEEEFTIQDVENPNQPEDGGNGQVSEWSRSIRFSIAYTITTNYV